MQNFINLKDRMGLKRFLYSPLGTLYFTPFPPEGTPKLIVRHFDNDLANSLVVPFVDLFQAVKKWVENHPKVNQFVSVETPIEFGFDYVTRLYHMYHTSTRSYVSGENPPNPPEELEQMRNNLRSQMGKSSSSRDCILEAILKRSLLEPTGKTYFAESRGKFIVVEPKFTSEDVERWATLEKFPNR
jgi:hypothetical protein